MAKDLGKITGEEKAMQHMIEKWPTIIKICMERPCPEPESPYPGLMLGVFKPFPGAPGSKEQMGPGHPM